MEPYTVAGLARRENEAVDCGPEDLDPLIASVTTVTARAVVRGLARSASMRKLVHLAVASGRSGKSAKRRKPSA